LRGIDVTRQQDIDHVMLELDGTKNKSKLGANAILSVSLACAQVAALERGIPLWKSLRQTYRFVRPASLPIPTMNVLNGGAHAGWVMDIQECMIVPRHKQFSERVRIGVEVFQALGKLLKEKHLPITVGDEGGFAPHLDTVEKAFDLLAEAVAKAGFKLGKDVCFAADVASSEFYDAKRKKYVFRAEGVEMDREQLMARYAGWMEKYPFESIEDPFAEDDWASWQEALPMFEGNEVRVVGDDLLVTNVERLQRAIDEQAANTILIKLNQIGTLTETVDAIKMAHAAGWATSISHRSGETADTTIADLAVACGSEYIKTGSLSRSERIEKYNRLLEIEGEM
jgi:enolase